MSAFDAGNRVQLLDLDGYVHNNDQGLWVGNTGTVTKIDDEDGTVYVSFDNTDVNPVATLGLPGWPFRAKNLEKIDG